MNLDNSNIQPNSDEIEISIPKRENIES